MSQVNEESGTLAKASESILDEVRRATADGGSFGLDKYFELGVRVAAQYGVDPKDLHEMFRQQHGDEFRVTVGGGLRVRAVDESPPGPTP